MGDLLNLILPFVSTPKDYGDVLRKLAACAFYEVYLITFFLRDIPQVGRALRSAETFGSLGTFIETIPHSAALNLAGVLIAFCIAMISFVVQFHNKISDLLGIRSSFDQEEILVPLARLVGTSITPHKRNEIAQQRNRLMREVFYKYASSRSERPLVDRHEIEHALGRWTWFWALVEAIVFVLCASIIAFVFGATTLGVSFFIVAGGLVILALMQYSRLGRYATAEIEAIADDETAARDVKARFDAL
jgi:hypothetical protein